MNIALVDLKKQYETIAEDLEKEVLAVLRSCYYISGPKVAEFERSFANLHNAEYCVAVNSGTAALHLALWALNVKAGDEVIVPVNTYVATAEAVSLTGATPVFVDHNEFFNIDPAKLKNALTSKTRAVIPVHLYGQPINVSSVQDFCRENNLLLIEDCAQAHMAAFNNHPVGTFGDAGCFSMYPGKNLGACGESGAVVTNNKQLYERIKRLHQHGVKNDKYSHIEPGHNYRMEEVQAAALNVKIKHIEAWTEKRRTNAALYRKYLTSSKNLQMPHEMPGAKHVYHLFVIQADRRDELAAYLNDCGIATGLHYPTPLHLQKAYSKLGYSKGAFPVAEKACLEILSLPMFPELTETEIKYICTSINEFYN